MLQQTLWHVAALVRVSCGLRSATQWWTVGKQRDDDNVCWQLSLEIQQRAMYAGSLNLQSMHASHAERAGWLRGGLGEAEGTTSLHTRKSIL